MKKIAVASTGSVMANDFSTAEGFRIYEFDGTTIHPVDYFDREDFEIGTLPEFLKGLEVVEVFSGNMTKALLDQFKALDIQVITGLMGDIAETIVGHHLTEILDNKKRGMKPLSSCHTGCGSDH